jgi:hypothetical protein
MQNYCLSLNFKKLAKKYRPVFNVSLGVLSVSFEKLTPHYFMKQNAPSPLSTKPRKVRA